MLVTWNRQSSFEWSEEHPQTDFIHRVDGTESKDGEPGRGVEVPHSLLLVPVGPPGVSSIPNGVEGDWRNGSDPCPHKHFTDRKLHSFYLFVRLELL